MRAYEGELNDGVSRKATRKYLDLQRALAKLIQSVAALTNKSKAVQQSMDSTGEIAKTYLESAKAEGKQVIAVKEEIALIRGRVDAQKEVYRKLEKEKQHLETEGARIEECIASERGHKDAYAAKERGLIGEREQARSNRNETDARFRKLDLQLSQNLSHAADMAEQVRSLKQSFDEAKRFNCKAEEGASKAESAAERAESEYEEALGRLEKITREIQKNKVDVEKEEAAKEAFEAAECKLSALRCNIKSVSQSAERIKAKMRSFRSLAQANDAKTKLFSSRIEELTNKIQKMEVTTCTSVSEVLEAKQREYERELHSTQRQVESSEIREKVFAEACCLKNGELGEQRALAHLARVKQAEKEQADVNELEGRIKVARADLNDAQHKEKLCRETLQLLSQTLDTFKGDEEMATRVKPARRAQLDEEVKKRRAEYLHEWKRTVIPIRNEVRCLSLNVQKQRKALEATITGA